MSRARQPVALWRDQQGWWTGRVADHWRLTAVAEDARSVVQQLKAGLETSIRQHGDHGFGDWQDAELTTQRFTLRPVIQGRGRAFQSPQALHLTTQVLRGRLKGGGWAVAAPLLGLQVALTEAAGWKGALEQLIQEEFQSRDPGDLRQALTAVDCSIEWLPIPAAPTQSQDRNHARADGELAVASDHLDERLLKRLDCTAHQRLDAVTDLVERLCQGRDNILVVSETGGGKTTVILDAIRRCLRQEKGPSSFHRTSAARIIAGMAYLGQWEQRVDDIIDELSDANGVLVVENLLDLLRMGGQGADDSIGAYLRHPLRQNRLRLITEATPREVAAARLQLPDLLDNLAIIDLQELTRSQSLAVTDALITPLAQTHHIDVKPAYAAEVVDAFTRFMPGVAYPGPAVGFLRNELHRAARQGVDELDQADALLAFARWSGLDRRLLDDSITMDHAAMTAELCAQVLGQDSACERAADIITTFKAGLVEPGRPLTSLLFCGPTGVGKTALVKALATALFPGRDADQRLLRLDCSELGGYDAVHRFLGTDHEPSAFLQSVREQGFRVVLFDEIEKADPHIFDILLGILDEGRITDGLGRVTSFRSTAILLTSNLGAEDRTVQGFATNIQPADRYHEAISSFFRPEFVNRLDGIIPFRALDTAIIAGIIDRELAAIVNRPGIARRGLSLAFTVALKNLLKERGFDPELGARPLQQTIDRLVVRPLAEHLLNGTATGSNLQIDWREGLTITDLP